MRTMVHHELGMKMGGSYPVPMRVNGVVRHVHCDADGKVVLWEECDPAEGMYGRDFVLVETGDAIPDNATYVGTVQIPPQHHHGGAFRNPLAMHVFQLAA